MALAVLRKRTGSDCGPQPEGRQVGLQFLLEWSGGGRFSLPRKEGKVHVNPHLLSSLL